MTEVVREWLSAFAATQQLRECGVVEPVSTLLQLAEAGQVRARASSARFDWADDVQEFLKEPEMEVEASEALAPWPDVPAEFWRWVNAGEPGTEVHVEAGVFATTVAFNVLSETAGGYRHKEHIKLYGVTFRKEDIGAVLGGVPELHPTPSLAMTTQSTAGRPPDLERWAEFGAALAFVAHSADPSVLASQTKLYNAAAEALAKRCNPLDEKTVRPMLRNAVFWIKEDKIPPRG